jgi:phytoene synthase
MRARPEGDLDECRRILRAGSRSFFLASLALPRRVRRAASALYAMCRVADDAVDEPRSSLAAVARLEERIDRAFRGAPADHPVDRSFADVVQAFRIPRAVPTAMLEGFRWDLEGRRYAELADLEAYAVRVASTVGTMMTLVMGVRDPVTLARASELGVAMQLTNVARDVGEDARNGRVYLPLSWLAEEGVDPDAFLRAPRFVPGIGRVVARLLAAADVLYARADAGIAALPRACRPAIHLARLFYSDIGRTIARRGHDSVSSRAVVSPARRLRLLVEAVRRSAWPRLPADRSEALPAARFLLATVEAAPPPPAADRGRPATLEAAPRACAAESGRSATRADAPCACGARHAGVGVVTP